MGPALPSLKRRGRSRLKSLSGGPPAAALANGGLETQAAPTAPLQQQPPLQQQQTSKGNHRNELPLLLDGVRVVLVSPKTPANIGSVLRVAENFEAHDVVVVDPRCDPRSNEVDVTSCSSQVMQSMRVMPTLAAALADCTGSIGFTRRAGAGRIVHASLHQLLAQFPAAVPALLTAVEPQQSQQQDPQQQQHRLQDPQQPQQQQQTGSQEAAVGTATVALVFGREESGLLESELMLCSHACSIPSGRSQPSLNLSHAVAVVVSQLFDIKQQRLLAANQQQQQQQQQVAAAGLPGLDPSVGPLAPSGSLFEDDRMRWRREVALAPANQAELEALLQRMAALLQAAGISAEESVGGGPKSNHGRRKRLMGHARSMLLRSQASAAEVRALHGLCKELEGRAEAAQQQQAG
ncbi:hypothetical protein D9Q98_006919 [Chlorella vulgaris]|uniref:tRNA/rRNA methyltransferase SpoU type domain-containing protein n=1 Tax=Chlorella vulgaris TaxID=3077 RepID=A0A9D4TJ41_CHLVU|nr:hypothetical protein D9Q98_006919 [Chlorella vulgaris]